MDILNQFTKGRTLTPHHVLCCAQMLSGFRLFETPWTVAHQALLSMGRNSLRRNTGVGCHTLLTHHHISHLKKKATNNKKPKVAYTGHFDRFQPLHPSPQYLWTLWSLFKINYQFVMGFPCSSVGKNPPASAGNVGSFPGSGISAGEGNGNPLQYSCLGNPRDRGAWWTTVHGVTKSWTQTSNQATRTMHLSQSWQQNLHCTVAFL